MRHTLRLVTALLAVMIVGGCASTETPPTTAAKPTTPPTPTPVATPAPQPDPQPAPQPKAKPGPKLEREIVVGILIGLLKYDTDRIFVKPGETVAIRFENKEEMPHNLVICDRGTNIKTIADAAVALGADGLAKNYLPDSPKILAATPLVMENKQHTIIFTAPKQPGEYPYVCTFPGHYMLMNGILQVGGKPPAATPLENLTFKRYQGKWEKLPDFSQLKPVQEGKAEKNLVNVNAKGFPSDNYGLVYTGTLRVPKTGKYVIRAASDDGARILIDGKKAWEDDGIHPAKTKTKTIELEAGQYPVEIQFFENSGQNDFRIDWSGPGIKNQAWSVAAPGGGGGNRQSVLLAPVKRPVIYRNFFGKAPSRGIGIGFPGGANALFDANYCRWQQLWRGAFVDAGIHWTGRGQGQAQPAGEDVVDLFAADPAAILADGTATWPARQEHKGDVPGEKSPVLFQGYDLDANGYPTMLYRIADTAFSDTLTPVLVDGNICFERRVTVTRSAAVDGLHLFAARAKQIEKVGPDRYRIGDELILRLETDGCQPPEIRPNDDGFDLIIPVKNGSGIATLKETIQW